MAQRSNPFLPDNLQYNFRPESQTPQPTQQAPTTAPQAQPRAPQPENAEFEGRKQRWKQYLNDPRVQAGLFQFGIAMMTPGVGLGQAVGAGIGAAGRVPQMQRERQAQEREAALDERRLANEERRTGAYEQSVQQAGQRINAPGSLTDMEELLIKRGMTEKDAFEKMIRDRAQEEHEAAMEVYQNNQLLGGEAGPPPDYNEILDRVAAEEVMRKRGVFPLYAQLPPEDQQAFMEIARKRGLEVALQTLEQVVRTRQAPVDTTKPQPEQPQV